MTLNNKHNLLLVDDDRLVLVTLARGLIAAGYNVATAESADDAEALLASGERPDLIILDVRMPGRSGLALAERLRLFDHIPFMLLTAYNDHDIVEKAAIFGALGYLVKPIDTPQLVPAIEAALARAAELQGMRTTEQQLLNALDNERDISVAIGITMVQYRLSRKAAFELLRKTARDQRRKLADMAMEVVSASEIMNLTE
ncbi:MAG: response regulator [Methylococcales bacterium]|nr:response regulator [Methylococcales bacterium]